MNKRMNTLSNRNVRIHPSFWGDRIKVVKESAIPYQWDALNNRVSGAEPSHSVNNFRIAGGAAEGNYQGKVFQDSDLYKWLEAVSYYLEVNYDQNIEGIADQMIELIAKAQQPDGYINTYFTVQKPGERWTNLREDHELYCGGHMIEAAAAHFRATGKRKFLDVACRFADLVDTVFGPEQGKLRGYDGHQEIELALVKLYQVTGESRYLRLSQFFLEERGQQPNYLDQELETRKAVKNYELEHYQAHIPVREQTTADGHAVRAMYMFSGMADVAAETGDENLFEVCKQIWGNVVGRRMYVTGGVGSTGWGESFTFDYDLPNDVAYAETCAAIGLIFWAHRMLLRDVNHQYADVMERALYNGALSGMALDGKTYFYSNPLEMHPETCEKRTEHRTDRLKSRRQPWWPTACCPPNISRLLTSLGQYMYSHHANEIYVHLYADSDATFDLAGHTVTVSQKTKYPWDGQITFQVSSETPLEYALNFRIPGWCRDAALKVNGEPAAIKVESNGYAAIHRVWQDGDQVELLLSMPVERLRSHPNVRANAGKTALQRGPILYCLEEADNGANLPNLSLPKESDLTVHFDSELLGGVSVITTDALRTDTSSFGSSLYEPVSLDTKPVKLQAIPYFAWANRTPGEMQVWIREV